MTEHTRKTEVISASATAGLAAALICLLCLLVGLNSRPKLYPVDYGQYSSYLNECSLRYAPSVDETVQLQAGAAVTSFEYAHFSWSKLLTPSVRNVNAYGVAIVRLFTEPFGIPFYLDALAYVWAAFLSSGIGFITYGLHRTGRKCFAVPAVIAAVTFLDANFCALLRGLYPVSGTIVFTILFLAAAVMAFSSDEISLLNTFAVVALGGIMLKGMPPLLVFAVPFIVMIILLIRKSSERQRRELFAATVLFASFVNVRGAIDTAVNDSDYNSYPAAYENFFNAALISTQDNEKSEALAFVGLDDSYLPDIGKSFYENESSYTHNPRDDSSNQKLKECVTPSSVLRFYFSHPEILNTALKHFPYSANSFENVRNTSRTDRNPEQHTVSAADSGMLSFAFRLAAPSHLIFTILSIAVGVILIFTAVYHRRNGSAEIHTGMSGWLGLAMIFSVLYLPVTVIFNGYALASETILYQTFLSIALMISIISICIEMIPVFERWMTKDSEEQNVLRQEQPPGAEKQNRRILKPGRLVFWCSSRLWMIPLLMGTLMLLFVLLRNPHAGSVNNGDYGRMLAQLGMTWTGDTYYDFSGQLNRVIENYEYLEPFSWKKLTPLEPTYTLYYFMSLIRPFAKLSGLPASTWTVEWIMGILTVLCIVMMTKDLQKVIGKYAIIPGILLPVIFINETYFVWFNSMFGESCILIGLLLTLMCAVHIAVMPRKGFLKRLIWFLLLLVSMYILIGAKAQMLMAVPACVILYLALLYYHRPFRYDYQALCAALAVFLMAGLVYGGVGVYRSDRISSEVSERHTMWQAYFYGIFMISDDPVGDMEKLGIDTAMAQDIGKYVSFSSEDYVYKPMSDEAKTSFYDHVSTKTIIEWYLTHPKKLWYMMNVAAKACQESYTGFRAYAGQDYSAIDHDSVDGLGLWLYSRKYLVPWNFAGYVFVFLVFLVLLIKNLRRELRLRRNQKITESDETRGMLGWILFFLMFVSIMQYPLSVIGNGFADNQKQLFGFSSSYDLLIVVEAVIIIRWLNNRAGRKNMRTHRQCRRNNANTH